MTEFTKEDMQTKRLTGSGIVTTRPAWLYTIIGNSYGDSSSLINVYSGRDTSGKVLLDLSGSQYGSDIVVFNIPIFFEDGIYCDFATNGYSVFTQFIPVY